MDNKLLRYGAKEYLMKAVVCDMNADVVKGHNTLQKFEQYPLFADSREYALLKVSYLKSAYSTIFTNMRASAQ